MDVLPNRRVKHGDLEAILRGLKPRRELVVEGVAVAADVEVLPGRSLEHHDVTLADTVRRDVHPLAVHRHVTVANELASLVAACTPSGTVGHVVEAKLEHDQQVLAGDPLTTVRLLIEIAELRLEKAVDTASLLLLTKLREVLGALAHTVTTVLARGVVATGAVGDLVRDRALHGVAALSLKEQLRALSTAEPADGTCIAGHEFFFSLRPGAASWGGSRCGGWG